MAGYLTSLRGEIQTDRPVVRFGELSPTRLFMFDGTPRQLLAITGERLPPAYRHALEAYRHRPGVFKVDWALGGSPRWKAEACAQAGTVHLGGRLEEIAAAEQAFWRGEHPERPYVLFAQQGLFDPSRAPMGKHTARAYCHVQPGSSQDMTDRIEAQVKRFAPGFRNRIRARYTRSAAAMELHNPNYIGGDINGGVQDLRQLFTRPVTRPIPYSTPLKEVYLCSSSTPPGGAVRGMCGYQAARAALRALPKPSRSATRVGAGVTASAIGR